MTPETKPEMEAPEPTLTPVEEVIEPFVPLASEQTVLIHTRAQVVVWAVSVSRYVLAGITAFLAFAIAFALLYEASLGTATALHTTTSTTSVGQAHAHGGKAPPTTTKLPTTIVTTVPTTTVPPTTMPAPATTAPATRTTYPPTTRPVTVVTQPPPPVTTPPPPPTTVPPPPVTTTPPQQTDTRTEAHTYNCTAPETVTFNFQYIGPGFLGSTLTGTGPGLPTQTSSGPSSSVYMFGPAGAYSFSDTYVSVAGAGGYGSVGWNFSNLGACS